jgi:deoxyribonuclease-1
VVLVRAVVVVFLAVLLVYLSTEGVEQFQLEQTVTSTHQNDTGSSKIRNYAEARIVFWRELYPKQFTTLYCGETYADMPSRGVNIEHVFPMGWVTKSIACGTRDQCRANALFNRVESDLHNLYPSRTDVNQARGSFRFANIAGEAREFGAQCDFEVNQRQRAVEPRPEVRGDIARAMFYMVNRYPEAKLQIFPKQQQLLKKWHRADPPSDAERSRNDLIQRLQGNRNPYVDAPDTL